MFQVITPEFNGVDHVWFTHEDKGLCDQVAHVCDEYMVSTTGLEGAVQVVAVATN